MITGLILSLIAFAGASYSMWLAVSQNKKLLNEIQKLLNENQYLAERNKEKQSAIVSLINLCAECNPDNITYTAEDSFFGFVKVLKKVGSEWCIVKIFHDSDHDFNLREAQELVETLNSK